MFESRAYELTEEDFINLLNENCKDFVKTPMLLQRNKKGGPKFSCINPKTNIRTAMLSNGSSAGVRSNHNTLLMDNLPSWSKFPKRSQSIIGLTTTDRSSLFGDEKFFVIPFDGAKFGVCPAKDLWGVGCDKFDTSYSMTFDYNLSNMLIELNVSDNSYDNMMNDLQERYDKWLEEGGKRVNDLSVSSNRYNTRALVIFSKIKDLGYTDVKIGLSDIFDPKNFKANMSEITMKGFSVMKWKENPYGGLSTSFDPNEGHEFWTDSECLLYKIDMSDNIVFSKIEDSIKNEFDNMIKKYIKS